MKSFHNIRMQFHRQFLNQELKQNPRDESKLVNFENAKSIGIIFDATDTGQRDKVLKYAEQLRKKQKSVKTLGFLNSKQEDPNFTFKYFNLKNIDWAYRPNGEDVSNFIQQSFDLLINLETTTKSSSEYIAALSKANLRIGPYTENTFCYDLMIDTGNKDLDHFIKEIERVLQKTNNSHEAAKI